MNVTQLLNEQAFALRMRSISTAPIDETHVREAVSRLYHCLHRDKPEVLFADSPLDAHAIHIARSGGPSRKQVREFESAYASTHLASASSALLEHKNMQLRHGLGAFASAAQEIGQSVHALWIFEDYAIACRRPIRVSSDENGYIHDDEGPALKYADGTEVYVVHGIVLTSDDVDRYWGEDRPIEFKALMKMRDVRKKRAIISARVGWDYYLDWMRTHQPKRVRLLDTHPNDARLIEIEPRGESEMRFIECYNHTCETCLERIKVCACEHPVRKRYVEGVPMNANTVLEAHAWRWGLSVELTESMIEDRA